MKCAKCNTENNYYHKFCYYCGSALKEGEAIATGEDTENLSQSIVFNSNNHVIHKHINKRREDNIRKIVLAVCGVTALAIIYMIVTSIT